MGHGQGGHFHSLNHISREIAKENNIGIISIGPGFSPVVSNNPFFFKHINFNGFRVLNFKKQIQLVVKDFSPEIIHFFDSKSYLLVKPFIDKKSKYVLNKCGGPSPKKTFPYIKNLVLFSQEDYIWFKKYKPFENSNITLIPNRVHAINLNGFKPIAKDKENFTFVRIARIGSGYKKSIIDSINLVDRLSNNKDLNVKLIVIGKVQATKVYNELLDLAKNNSSVEFITNDEYTKEASKMLYLADAVIGTGRSIMEAASLKLPILSIDKEGDIPVLLNEITFDDAFKTNFSERNIYKKKGENFWEIVKMIEKPSYYRELSKFSYQMFLNNFDIKKATHEYQKVYSNVEYNDESVFIQLKTSIISYLRLALNFSTR